MVIGAVMVSNVFTGLYTESWSVWVWVAVLVGPVLIWLYTVSADRRTVFVQSDSFNMPLCFHQAIYSVIPPSTFATNAYGNE